MVLAGGLGACTAASAEEEEGAGGAENGSSREQILEIKEMCVKYVGLFSEVCVLYAWMCEDD